jgi:hypothetical protein
MNLINSDDKIRIGENIFVKSAELPWKIPPKIFFVILIFTTCKEKVVILEIGLFSRGHGFSWVF